MGIIEILMIGIGLGMDALGYLLQRTGKVRSGESGNRKSCHVFGVVSRQ